jgi:uncharacterized protein YoxC
MLKKVVESIKSIKSVGVKSAIIGAIAIVLAAIIGATTTVTVTVIRVLNSRSQLAEENSAYVKTIESKDAIIEDLNRRLSEKDSELQQRISQKDAELQRLQADFIPFKTVAIANYKGSEEERLKQLADEIQKLNNPLTKLIASATARVEVTIKSEEKTQTYMDVGGYLAFVKDRAPLLFTASTRSDIYQNGKGEATYKGDFSIEPGQSAVGKPMEILQASDLIQIGFNMIPANSPVLRGKASVVINGDTRFEFEISPQKMQDNKILIRDVKQGFVTKR